MIEISNKNRYPMCNSCGKETNTLDIKLYFKNYMNSCSSFCLCDDCRKELIKLLKEKENNA